MMELFVKLYHDIIFTMSHRNFTIILITASVGILVAHLAFHNNDLHRKHFDKKTQSKVVMATNSVKIKNFAYSPQKIKVKKGTTVVWENQDIAPHTVTKTDKSKSGPDSENFGKGGKYSYTFTETGQFEYFCKPHPYMKATVEVIE
jgi:plastocyanin